MLIGLLLAACSALGSDEQQEATASPIAGNNSESSISNEEATQLMYVLSGPDILKAQDATDQVVAAKDERFVAVFIELIRGAQLNLLSPTRHSMFIVALENLSGQSFGADWPAWVEWYGGTELVPPEGFTGWKGILLSTIDIGFVDFLQDDFPSVIRVEEIQWGGVLIDGIPALDNPAMVGPEEAFYLVPEEPVFGIAINGEARAYPLRIMDWHEMANDVVGGVPFSLAYCTLCGAGIAFDGRAANGETYTFGSSGFLYRSNKLMYDRQSRTLWNQLTGQPVLGPLVDERISLELLPIVLTSWADWLESHPETLVLDIKTGFDREYALGAAYGDYFSSADTMFPVWTRNDLLPEKARVYALRINGEPRAYPLELLAEEQVANDTLADRNIVLVANSGTVEVLGQSLRAGSVDYQAGGEVRAYERGEHIFQAGPDEDTLLDEEGNQWQITEEYLLGPNGERHERIAGHLAYWFGWFSFFPSTSVYGAP